MEDQYLRWGVGLIALVFALASFGVYFAYSTGKLQTPTQKVEPGIQIAITRAGDATTGVTSAEAADLIKALATLTDSLLKSGPALWSLIGAVLFLLIAGLAAGVLLMAG